MADEETKETQTEEQTQTEKKSWFSNIEISPFMKKIIIIFLIITAMIALKKAGLDVPQWLYDIGSSIASAFSDVYKSFFMM